MKSKIKNQKPKIILFGMIIAFALFFSWLALNRHVAFQSHGFDLGLMDQPIWNTAQGQIMALTNRGPVTNRLAIHVEPILFLFVPFYWLGLGGPKLLLVTQAIVVCLGAWPLYLIARPRLGEVGALLISFAYLLYPALEAALLFDFHAVAMAPTFILFAFYFLDKKFNAQNPDTANTKRLYPLAFVFILLAMSTKEDMGLVIAMLGLYMGLAYKRWKPALLMFVGGFAWSAIAILVIQPLFAAGGNIQSDRYDWLFEAVFQPKLIWEHLMVQVNLPAYLWGMLAPVAGLALLAPLALLPILPSLAINLLSNHPFSWRLEEFHYSAPMAPFIFIAVVMGLSWLRQRAPRLKHLTTVLLVLLVLASLSYHFFRGFTPLARPFQVKVVGSHQQLGVEMAADIDPTLPLFAPYNLNPHVSSRAIIRQDFEYIDPADWLWLDVSTLPNENRIQQYIRDELLPHYELVEAIDGYLLLKPGGTTQILPNQFYSFSRPAPAIEPQYPLAVVFGDDELALLGYDLHFNRAEEPEIVTYWRALKPLSAEINPVLFLADSAGNLQGETQANSLSPTLIWLPPEQWPVGETIKVVFNRLNWETRERTDFRLGVGVTKDPDPWHVAGRLRPHINGTPYANQLLAEGSVLEIARLQRIAGMLQGTAPMRQMQAPVVNQRLQSNFADEVALFGYNTPQQVQTEAGQAIRLELIWQALNDSRDDYVRFAHLVDINGLQGQSDSIPVDGYYPTTLWANGEYVAEEVVIPLEVDLPAGSYTLHIGLYNPATGERLTNELGQDHLEIPLIFDK